MQWDADEVLKAASSKPDKGKPGVIGNALPTPGDGASLLNSYVAVPKIHWLGLSHPAASLLGRPGPQSLLVGGTRPAPRCPCAVSRALLPRLAPTGQRLQQHMPSSPHLLMW